MQCEQVSLRDLLRCSLLVLRFMPHTHDRRIRTAQGGFTLLELVIIMVIMIILASVISASFGGALRSSHLRSDAAQLRALGVQARTRALLTGNRVVLRIDPSQGEAMLLDAKPSDTSSSTENDEGLEPLGENLRLHLSDGVEITSLTIDGDTVSDGDITYYSTGGATAAEIRMSWADDSSEEKVVTVNRATGRTKVE